MEQIIENATLFINVLGMSRTSAIQDWDIEELKRAVKWADYFQQVYLKLETRRKQRDILCRELKLQSCAHGTHLGISVLTFEDLKDAKQLLCKNILQNVWCSPEIYNEAIKLCYALPELNPGNHLLSSDVKEIAKLCYISKVLQPIGPELVKANTMLLQKDSIPADDEDCTKVVFSESYNNTDANNNIDFENDFSVQVQGRLLRTYILKCLGCAGSEDGLLSQIDAIFTNRGDDWHLLQFVCTEVDKAVPDFIQFIARFVKEKVIPKWKSNQSSFMDIPASFVLDLVVLSEEVFIAYVRLLYDCCQIYDKQTSMEELYLVTRMRKAQGVDSLKLQNLEKHFEEIHAREQQCIGLLRKAEDAFVTSVESGCDRVFSTWDRLVKKYSLFIS